MFKMTFPKFLLIKFAEIYIGVKLFFVVNRQKQIKTNKTNI